MHATTCVRAPTFPLQRSFYEELRLKYHSNAEADEVYEHIKSVFDALPLAAVVAQNVVVLNGGVGTGDWRLAHLNAVQRPISRSKLATLPRYVHSVVGREPASTLQAAVVTDKTGPIDNFKAANHIGMLIGSDQAATFSNNPDIKIKVNEIQKVAIVVSARLNIRATAGFLLVVEDSQTLRVRVKSLDVARELS